jgi:uncharacterized repeat protein (TIGR02543 family)
METLTRKRATANRPFSAAALFFSMITILFPAVSPFGAPVSFETAESVARKHVERTRGGKIRQAITPAQHKTGVAAPYFVFEKESGGFVIVAADNAAIPILGETYGGTFDKGKMPPALGWLLGTYEEQIAEAAKNGAAQAEETRALWEEAMRDPGIRKAAAGYPLQLLTTTWGQGEPYNLKTPVDPDSGKNSLTGCVSTAMAQIMKYWRHPAYGTGESEAYSSYYSYGKNISVPSVDFNAYYDYGNMLDNYPAASSGTAAQRDAVSTLMYHSGVSVETAYSYKVSSAYDSHVAVALNRHFDYDGSIRYIDKQNSYTNGAPGTSGYKIFGSEWIDLIIGQIENNSPVYYRAEDAAGNAHAFIIDGYYSADMFHINWGWDGNYDGFFALSALNYGTYQLSGQHAMIINIMPNTTGNPPSQIKVSAFNVSSTQTTVNVAIRAKMNYGADFSGKIGFAVMSGNTVSVVLDSADYSISNAYNLLSGWYVLQYESVNLSKQFSADTPYGDLTLQVVTRQGEGEWMPVGETRSIYVPQTYTIVYNLNGGASPTISNGCIITAIKRGNSFAWVYGAALNVVVNETNPSTTPAISPGNDRDIHIFNIAPGDVVAFYWIQGNYNGLNEDACAFAVYYSDNPPNPAFNPAPNASNDTANILLFKQYEDLKSVSTGTFLGSFTAAYNPSVYSTGTPTITLNPPTREGYTFYGWFTDPGFSGEAVSSIPAGSAGNKAFYAKWTLIAYSGVTFNAGANGTLTAAVDGSPIASGAAVLHGKSVAFTANPAEGYSVSGWTVNGEAVAGNAANAYTLKDFSGDAEVTVSFAKTVSVASPARVISLVNPGAAAAVPVSRLTAEFAAGPNPAGKSSGAVRFFRHGSRIEGATLFIYDASGNTVNKITVNDNAGGISTNNKRVVGLWDLRDAKGRPIGAGTYLARGVIKAKDGKKEKVSVAVGVR